MADANEIYRNGFIEYASEVIKERAIPDIEDGLKPVQRRLIHTLIEMDDGRFQKSANVVGSAMHYHPHGDQSLYEALVNLANCNLFIEKQGNFGNFMTGDRAAASRYTECRLLPFAKKVLYNPEITNYVESYDGRNKEPATFPAKIPVVLIQGTEGIAVGMSTKILPHNPLEVIQAQIAAIRGEDFRLYPDFEGGGIMDVSDYQDGLGSVLCRAKLDISNPKRITIEELPFGVDSEAMKDSIDDAAKAGKLKISKINDLTTDKVCIEIELAKGTYSQDVVDALYAYTKCENKISVNCLVIRDKLPYVMTVSDIVKYHANHIIEVSKAELEVERGHLFDKLHQRTLERIFIEERIYKRIEQKRTQEAVREAVKTGFLPFADQLVREVSDDDVESLLKIPIRRISLFDIEKNLSEIEDINAAIKKVDYNLSHIKKYAVGVLTDIMGAFGSEAHARKTVIKDFNQVDAKDIAKRELDLKYDAETGYMGTGIKGESQILVSEFDRVLVFSGDGSYFVTSVSEKFFVGKDVIYCCLADKATLDELVFTAIYQDMESRFLYIKRFQFSGGFIANKAYQILPDADKCKLRKLNTFPDAEVTVVYKGANLRIKEDSCLFSDFKVHNPKAAGVQLARKEVSSIRIKQVKKKASKPESSVPSDAPEADRPEPEDRTVIPSDEPEGPGLFD